MKRAIGVACPVVVAVTLMLVPTPRLKAQGFTPAQNWGSQPRAGVCFYLDENYRGESFCMNSGETMPTLDERYNDRISPVRIFGGARVVVYENEDYSGEDRTITRDVPDLGSLNDKIGSIRVR